MEKATFAGLQRLFGLHEEGRLRNLAEVLTIIAGLLVLYFMIIPSPFDFDSYWLGSWAVREGRPELMYSTLSAPEENGLYNLANQTDDWKQLMWTHIDAPRRMWGYIYPPPCAALFLPMTYVPYRLAVIVWRVLNLGCFLGGGLMLLHLTRRQVAPVTAQALTFLLALAPPLLAALAMGQVTPLVVFTVVAGLYYGETGRPGLAGIWLALGTLIKVSPLIFLIWLLLRRQFRAVAAWAVTLLGLSALSALFTGLPVFQTYLGHVLPLLSRGTPSGTNLSAIGLVGRFLHPDLAATAYILPQDPRISLFKLGFYAFLLLVSGLAFWLAWRRTGIVNSLLSYAVINMVALLASPITWGHHLLAASLTLFIVTARALSQKKRIVVALAGLAYFLMLQNGDLPGHLLPEAIGVVVSLAGVLMLWLLACGCLICARPETEWQEALFGIPIQVGNRGKSTGHRVK